MTQKSSVFGSFSFIMSQVQKYKLTISYDGTNYAGWQVQGNKTAIQPLVQNALVTILRHPTNLTGSGRTDAGVHALAQVAHFETPLMIDPNRTRFSLNALLPPDIRIMNVEKADPLFHARYSATSKIYHYHIHLDPTTNPFDRLYKYHFMGQFNKDLLLEATPHFLGTKDFTSFANQPNKGSASRDPVRTLFRIDCAEEQGGVRLEFEANGFLYKMVRNITGTLLDVASKKTPVSEISSIFAAKDRRCAKNCAPPHGLFLMHVNYKTLPKIHNASHPQMQSSPKEDDAMDKSTQKQPEFAEAP